MKIQLTLFSYGGVHGATVDSLLDELAVASGEMYFGRVADDALISRSRSVAASRFLETPCDVWFMLDHDLSWRPGDVTATCQKALEVGSVVAGMYSYRSMGKGHASRLAKRTIRFPIGEDVLMPADYVASGFCAVPRAVLVKIVECGLVTRCLRSLDGEKFYDFFRPIVIPSTVVEGEHEYLSEDWSFCRRAVEAGFKTLVYAKPALVHHGDYGYRVVDGIPQESR